MLVCFSYTVQYSSSLIHNAGKKLYSYINTKPWFEEPIQYYCVLTRFSSDSLSALFSRKHECWAGYCCTSISPVYLMQPTWRNILCSPRNTVVYRSNKHVRWVWYWWNLIFLSRIQLHFIIFTGKQFLRSRPRFNVRFIRYQQHPVSVICQFRSAHVMFDADDITRYQYVSVQLKPTQYRQKNNRIPTRVNDNY